MKKLLTVMFAGLFLLAIAGPAMAELTIGGQIEIDGWMQDSYPAFPDDAKKFYNQENRLDFKGSWGDVSGRVRLEYDYDWSNGNQNKGDTNQNPLDLAYLKFAVPSTPLSISAGLQGLAFGKAFFVDDSFYYLAAIAGFGDNSLTLGTIKIDETYLVDEDTDGYFGIFSTKAVPGAALDVMFITWSDSADFEPWDLGVYLNGAAGAAKYWVEGHYQGGSYAKDSDLSAYALAAGVGASMGMADVSFYGVYGSGDGDTDSDYESYLPLSPDAGTTLDFIVVDDLLGNSIANVWALGASATAKPMDKVSVMARVNFYNHIEEVVADETYVGTEIDLKGSYKISDNLSWTVGFGYLATGDGLAAGYDENPFELNNEFMLTF